ncbi:unnamed protein product [Caenorhabditis sp. 36 PRJEB53466]|nr:unnamed protein product [Caenorhabditis sp. 36 PRJEB53466]
MGGPVGVTVPNEQRVQPPSGRYFMVLVPEEGVLLAADDDEVQQDPKLVMTALLCHRLYGRYFGTNVPKVVYNFFSSRSDQWKTYANRRGWRAFKPSNQRVSQLLANSIAQEYEGLARMGRERKCMFALEHIGLHLTMIVSLEDFFDTLIE